MFLDAVVQVKRIFQGLPVARGTDIFRQSVEGKADGIELLPGVLGLSLVVEAPIDATIFLVDEMIDEIVLGVGGRLQILLLTQDTVGSRERPEDTGIEDSPLLCLGMQHLLGIDTPIEAPVLAIHHLGAPEVQDVLLKNILHLTFHCTDIHYSMARIFFSFSLISLMRSVVRG